MITWELSFNREHTDGDTYGGYTVHVVGPNPRRTEWSEPHLAVPADVRAYAQYNGRVNGAHHVFYASTRLADVRGYSQFGTVHHTAASVQHGDEPIRPASR